MIDVLNINLAIVTINLYFLSFSLKFYTTTRTVVQFKLKFAWFVSNIFNLVSRKMNIIKVIIDILTVFLMLL